jgi:hypothetical protein
MATCQNCGVTIAGEQTLCASCEQSNVDVRSNGGQQQPRQPPRREEDDDVDRRGVLVLLGAGVAGVGGWFFFLRDDGNDSQDGGDTADGGGDSTTDGGESSTTDDGGSGSDLLSPESPGANFGNAPEVSEGRHGPYQIMNGGEHYFSVDLSEGDQLTVTIEFAHSEGDLELRLFDATQTQQDLQITSNDNETASLTAQQSGLHYINPYGFMSATNDYELVVEIN